MIFNPRTRLQSQIAWQVGDTPILLGCFPKLMGIVNTTPDSFSDGGQFCDVDATVGHALELEAAGADFLDVGGESTRPGAQPVSEADELRRVIPVVSRLAGEVSVPISIDTTKAEVARQALAAGATIVNDISGLTFDPQMPAVCAASNCGVIVMHIQGTPQTMQNDPHYENVIVEICDHFTARLEQLATAGIAKERIVLDPGIGFGKTAEHNLQILSHIGRFRELGCPVLIGHSRKRFLGKVLGKPLDERVYGTAGVAIALAQQGGDIIRVHDVAAVGDCLTAWQAVMERVDG